MWSRTDSELKDIARKCKTKMKHPFLRVLGGPEQFWSAKRGYLSSDGKISIVGMLEVDIRVVLNSFPPGDPRGVSAGSM